ncbi:MAG: LytTR family transcriptional regulator [Spirosomaceae bacterium]|nr:LytTR family transcriptional regulator [Spirosomataceae bacterium]
MNTQPLLVSPQLPILEIDLQYCVIITNGNRQIEISFEQLVCLEGCGNYTYLYTCDGKRHLSSKTLKWFANILDKSKFVRIHKSSIINWAYLKDFSDCERAVRLKNGREIAISRRRSREVRTLAHTRSIS